MSKMLQVGGLTFHIEDEGDGRPVVLLHGFPDTSRLWRHQIPALVDAGRRCVAPDMRGRGRTDRPAAVQDYALSKMVADVTGILDQLEMDRVDVVGHDWGAAVAWLVASLAPERVDRLVAISVGFPGAAGLPRIEALQKMWYRILIQFEGVAEELFLKDDQYLFKEWLRDQGDAAEYVAQMADPAALTAGFNWYRANLPVERLLAPAQALPNVKADTLAIYGSRDDYVAEVAMTASEAKIDGRWRYERFEGVGHWVPLEAADRLNELLLEFLS